MSFTPLNSSNNGIVSSEKPTLKPRKSLNIIGLVFIFFTLIIAIGYTLYYLNKPVTVKKKAAIEEGQPCGLDVMLVLDYSGSMNDAQIGDSTNKAKLEWAKEGANSFINALEQLKIKQPSSQIRMGITTFGRYQTGDEINGYLKVGLTNDLSSVKSTISQLKGGPSPGTCIECGLNVANDNLDANPPTMQGVKQKLVVLSDGRGNRVKLQPGVVKSHSEARPFSTNQANSGRARGYEYYVIGFSGEASTKSDMDIQTLLEIAGDSPSGNDNSGSHDTKHFRYRNAGDWPSTFASLVGELCEPLATPTPSNAPTLTPSTTPPILPSLTPTLIPPTLTLTPTSGPSLTPTLTPIITPSDSPTGTPTLTPTTGPSSTPAPTNTPSLSSTPTNTPTPTEIILANATNTPTTTKAAPTALPEAGGYGRWPFVIIPALIILLGLLL